MIGRLHTAESSVAAETLKKLDGVGASTGDGLVESGVLPLKFFLNLGANLCNMVHYWLKIRILKKSMFNLDFGRST